MRFITKNSENVQSWWRHHAETHSILIVQNFSTASGFHLNKWPIFYVVSRQKLLQKTVEFSVPRDVLTLMWRRRTAYNDQFKHSHNRENIIQCTIDISWNLFSCDQAALQMVFSVRLSVCLSVRLSVCPSICHTFLTMFPSSYHHEIFRSYY